MKNLAIEDPGMPSEQSGQCGSIEEGSGLKSPLCLLFLGSPAEAIHLGSLVAAHGYIFPISDHVLTLKDDGTLYRFQVRELRCEDAGTLSGGFFYREANYNNPS